MDFPILDDKSMANLQDRVHIYDLDNGMLSILLLSACLMVGAALSSWLTELLCFRGRVSISCQRSCEGEHF